MGSIRRSENIAKLVKLTATTAQLPASVINIGAQQYSTSALTLNTAVVGVGGVDATIAASSVYTVYAVVSSSTVYLIASLNSALPSGFTTARVVGGFVSDASSQISQTGSDTASLVMVVGAGNTSVVMTATSPKTLVLRNQTTPLTVNLPQTNVIAGSKYEVINEKLTNGYYKETTSAFIKTADGTMVARLFAGDKLSAVAKTDTPIKPNDFDTRIDRNPKSGIIGRWTAKPPLGVASEWTSVCWSAELGLFCAVNVAGQAATSPDGITWTVQASAVAFGKRWKVVIWCKEVSKFIAIGQDAPGPNVYQSTMTSTDGVTWVLQSPGTNNNYNPYNCCWSPELSLFVHIFFNGNPVCETSPDGVTWTITKSFGPGGPWAICWSPEAKLLVGVAYGTPGFWTSPDGTNWTSRTSPGSSDYWNSVCWSAKLGMFVTVAGNVGKIAWSYDGINWITSTSGTANIRFKTIIWCDELGMFVATGLATGTVFIATSIDGINWVYKSAPSGDYNDICYSPQLNMLVACNSTSTLNSMLISSL